MSVRRCSCATSSGDGAAGDGASGDGPAELCASLACSALMAILCRTTGPGRGFPAAAGWLRCDGDPYQREVPRPPDRIDEWLELARQYARDVGAEQPHVMFVDSPTLDGWGPMGEIKPR